MIPVKTAGEIVKMRKVCRIVADALKAVEPHIAPGVSTFEIDAIAERFILERGAKPNFKNYNGFPAAACISINDVVVHGIPSKDKIIKEGDIVSIDFGAVLDGFHADAARTIPAGKISKECQKLIDVTKQCFFEGLRHAKENRRVGDISAAIQNYAESNGFSAVRAMVGHGIGRHLHEEPSVPNFGAYGTGPLLKRGYCLAIEPMINEGTFHVKIDADKWTCRTADGKNSAHYENTVLITGGEPEILTL